MVELWKSIRAFFSSCCCYDCSIMSFGSTAHYFMALFIFDCSFVRKSLNTPLSTDGVQESAST